MELCPYGQFLSGSMILEHLFLQNTSGGCYLLVELFPYEQYLIGSMIFYALWQDQVSDHNGIFDGYKYRVNFTTQR